MVVTLDLFLCYQSRESQSDNLESLVYISSDQLSMFVLHVQAPVVYDKSHIYVDVRQVHVK